MRQRARPGRGGTALPPLPNTTPRAPRARHVRRRRCTRVHVRVWARAQGRDAPGGRVSPHAKLPNPHATPCAWQFRSILGFVSADEQPGFKEPMHSHEEPMHTHEEPMAEQPMPAAPDQDERSAQWQQPEEEQAGDLKGDLNGPW